MQKLLLHGRAICGAALIGVLAAGPTAAQTGAPPTEASSCSYKSSGISRAEIKSWNGAPTLFVDGKARSALAFYGGLSTHPSSAARPMAQAGVHIFNPLIAIDEAWKSPREYNWSMFDRALQAGLDADPKALYLLRITVDAPGWWKAGHPDAVGKGWRAGGGVYNEDWLQSFSSQEWRRDAGEALRSFISYLEHSRYATHILGYHICAGATGEWSYGWWGPSVHDYSKAQADAFRAWLREHHRGNMCALRAAWKDSAATFDTAAIPPGERRTRGSYFEYFDPSKGRAVSDYLEFHSVTVADAILHFAHIVKEETQRRKLFAVFFGYYFFADGALVLDVGHRALLKVLDSPDVDAIVCPYNYRERQIGGVALAQAVLASAKLHNKLFYAEDDTRTFLSPANAGYGRAGTLRDTVEILKRNYACYATQGASLWWMEQSPGWYNDPKLMELVAGLHALDEHLLAQKRQCNAEIAVIVSDQSTYYMRYSDALVEPMLNSQMVDNMTRLGAPFDTYLADDIGTMPEYKLYIFLNCPYFTPDQLHALRQRVLGGGHTVLWIYACGYITREGLSVDAMSRLIGIQVADEKVAGRPRLTIADYEHPITRSLPATQFEIRSTIGPLFSSVDVSASALGKLHATSCHDLQGQQATIGFTNRCGMAVKEIASGPAGGNWRSVWCGVPNLPSELLRGVAQWAGVHVYSTDSDAVYANDRLLGVHVRRAGERLLRLPRMCTVVDALSGGTVATDVTEFKVNLQSGETGLWLLK